MLTTLPIMWVLGTRLKFSCVHSKPFVNELSLSVLFLNFGSSVLFLMIADEHHLTVSGSQSCMLPSSVGQSILRIIYYHPLPSTIRFPFLLPLLASFVHFSFLVLVACFCQTNLQKYTVQKQQCTVTFQSLEITGFSKVVLPGGFSCQVVAAVGLIQSSNELDVQDGSLNWAQLHAYNPSPGGGQ